MFRTEISISPSPFRINHKSGILTLGSCFSDVIGEKLLRNKFNVLANPFGVAFNPESIFALLNACLNKNIFFQDGYIQTEDIWHNYHFHSELYGRSKTELEEKIRLKIAESHSFFQTANILTITLGSAFVYRLKANQQFVSNCHKQSSSLFHKELLNSDQIAESFQKFYQGALQLNPDLKIILTVSPVRHIKDTLQLNSVSKGILRAACHSITDKHTNISYFPAYEIMMDDLRDYRFYKKDMIHPSEVAEDYIWHKFMETYMEGKSMDFIKEWTAVRKALEHKAFHPESENHQSFIKETIRKIKNLSSQTDLSHELKIMEDRLK